jgi:GntR family transcriptional regulator, transcriptional repressor for pyruvate dehydrogenase complex
MDLHALLRPMSRQSLAARVAQTIKRYILTENLQAGDPLPSERQLAGSLVVSRTVLREALGILVGEGLITKEAGRGIFVLPYDREHVGASFALQLDVEQPAVDELIELRRAVEVGALGLAVQRITPAEIERLRDLVAQMQAKLAAGENIATEDVELHQALLDATRNPLLMQLRPLVEEVMRLTVERNLHALVEERDERAVDIMARLVEAVAGGDVWEARRLMEEHLTPPRFDRDF